MLIDAFVARDEDHLVDFRLRYLSGFVDLIIIAESEYTFGGKPKRLHFAKRKEAGSLPDNVKVYTIDIPQEILGSDSTIAVQDHVRREFAHRIYRDFPDSTVFFSDVDEIPSRSQARIARNLTEESVIMTVPMRMFCRKANWELCLRKKGWFSPKLFRGEPFPINIRSHFTDRQLDGEFGAHFSFLQMGTEEFKRKFGDYGHQEYNQEKLWTSQLITFCDTYGLDHLGRASRRGNGLLDFISKNDLPEVAREAIAFEPKWYGQAFIGSQFGRRVRATFIESLIHRRSNSKFFAPGWGPSFLEYCDAIFRTTARQFERWVRGLRRWRQSPR